MEIVQLPECKLSNCPNGCTGKPSSSPYVLAKAAAGATCTFTGVPASLSIRGWRIRKSTDGKSIHMVGTGTVIIVK